MYEWCLVAGDCFRNQVKAFIFLIPFISKDGCLPICPFIYTCIVVISKITITKMCSQFWVFVSRLTFTFFFKGRMRSHFLCSYSRRGWERSTTPNGRQGFVFMMHCLPVLRCAHTRIQTLRSQNISAALPTIISPMNIVICTC